MAMGKYSYSENRLALIRPAGGHEGSHDGSPELSAAVLRFPAREDPAPTTKWP